MTLPYIGSRVTCGIAREDTNIRYDVMSTACTTSKNEQNFGGLISNVIMCYYS